MSRHSPRGRPAGVTLVELLVVLAILGVIGTMGALALRGPRSSEAPLDVARREVTAARARALATGRAVRIVARIDGKTLHATALPDGSVVADGPLRVERLTGRAERE